MQTVAGNGQGAEHIERARAISASLSNPVLDGYLHYAAGNVAAGADWPCSFIAQIGPVHRADRVGSSRTSASTGLEMPKIG